MPSWTEPRAGDVWDVNFDPRIGREQGGLRPALVLSNDQFNAVNNRLHIVVPITGTDRGLAYHVRVSPPEGGLIKPSVIMCEQEKSQSIERFVRKRGSVSATTLELTQAIVGAFLDRERSSK